MQAESVLVLMGSDGGADEPLGSPPRIAYTAGEQRLSELVKCQMDQLMAGRLGHLNLLKLYPQRAAGMPIANRLPALDAQGVRPEVVARIAADMLTFFGPLHGGVIRQEVLDDVVVQGRTFSTAYPHINLDRFDCYDEATSAPLLGLWRARRLQNLRHETRTNRMLDTALLALEVGKSLFPLLMG